MVLDLRFLRPGLLDDSTPAISLARLSASLKSHPVSVISSL
jgi:hypothetical protein